MAIRTFRFLLAALPACSLGCAQGGQTYDDGSDGVHSRADGDDDDVVASDDDVGDDDDVANDDVLGDDDVTDDDAADDDAADDDAADDDAADDDDSSSTCEDIQAEVVVARDAAVAEVDISCQQDEDCKAQGYQPRCLATCGGSLALGRSDGDLLATAIGEIEDSLCRDFDDAGCRVLPPGCPVTSTPQAYEPRCVENECAYVEVDTADQCADLSRQAETLYDQLVTSADTSCSTVDDCTVVPNALSCAPGCPWAIGVNVSDEARVRSEMADGAQNICTPFSSLPCTVSAIECNTDDYEAACLDGRCVAQLPTASDCYAPDRNLDLAYSGTISGCPCSDEGSICILPVALVCSGGAWQAVEDGPCSPGVSESPCEGRVDSPMDCVDLFETCFELSTGTFCGVGHSTDLCPGGMIVQDASGCLQDDATCVELENGLYCTG